MHKPRTISHSVTIESYDEQSDTFRVRLSYSDPACPNTVPGFMTQSGDELFRASENGVRDEKGNNHFNQCVRAIFDNADGDDIPHSLIGQSATLSFIA